MQGVFEDLMRDYLPKLQDHLENLGVVATVSLSWFLTLFLCAMSFNAAVKVIDCFFYNGARVIFQLALTVFKVNNVRQTLTLFAWALLQGVSPWSLRWQSDHEEMSPLHFLTLSLLCNVFTCLY